jgi:CHAT domain-containing protein
MFSELGLACLDPRRGVPEPRRAQQAFDALQAFQARTLEERMQGVGLAARAMTRRVTADSLRGAVLRADEALLDLVATPETTFAFVITRGAVTAHLLPGTRRLDPLFADWRDALLGGAGDGVANAGLARLSGELLTPLADALRPARRIIVTGGGALTLWPFAALTLPGENGPLDATREIVAAPSATLFALLRGRAARRAAPGDLLAVSRTTDAAGRDLPGAERELAQLDHAYAHIVVRRNRGERTVPELTADLPRFDALHFAAHTDAVAGSPWRSGFLLGRGTGDDAYLRASTVARMKLRARLAVLSGCQSAGATALAGEGALGLTAGFLCAGTTTVIATLWPVEDRTAEQYMGAFYGALAEGQSAAAAARTARAALRARPATAHVRDWGAFVLVGEPTTRLALVPRRAS